MSLQLKIPDDVVQAIRLPEKRIERELLIELSLALYSQGCLSFGKARELTNMSKYEFGLLLGSRNIPRHYETEEAEEDIIYADSQ